MTHNTKMSIDIKVMDTMSNKDTYSMPEDGWVCFHCGERFMTPGGAGDHFGYRPSAEPGCLTKVAAGDERGWLMKIRKLEKSWDEMRVKLLKISLENSKLKAKL